MARELDEHRAVEFGDYRYNVFSEEKDKHGWPLVCISVWKEHPVFEKNAEVTWAAYGNRSAEFTSIFLGVMAEAVGLANALDNGWLPMLPTLEELKARIAREKEASWLDIVWII